MEVEEIQSQTQACKFSRIGNGRLGSTKMSQKDQYPDDEEDGEQEQQQLQLIRRASANDSGGAVGVNNTAAAAAAAAAGGNRLRSWHHSSRIIRVSRASGGKDRHSKVWTSKGLRDRRVRLSVTTAIQFYDLQDRLGYDQPSKAVEWLIKAAADSIAELPSLNSTFPDTPKQLSDEKRASDEGTTDQQGFDSVELDGDPNNSYQQNQSQHRSLSKSACSSNSETSKGSGLSLSRSESRVKARERARERAAKEKDQKENESQVNANRHHHHNVNPISQSSSFTELLTGGIGGSVNNNNNTSPTTASSQQQNEEPNFFHKATTAAVRPWPAAPMDYFNSALLGPSSSRPPHHHLSGQIQLGSSNSLPQAMQIPPFSITNENHHQEMQHFSFVPDHLIPVTATQPGPGGGDYFTISSSLGFNRGTLQSNSSPSVFPHIQRFGSSSPIDGSSVNVPFLIGTAPPVENHNHHHHQFPPGFDGRLHLYYGDGGRHSDSNQKDKGKN